MDCAIASWSAAVLRRLPWWSHRCKAAEHRRTPRRYRVLLGVLLVLPGAAFALTNAPLPRAHAHNDYLHARPLLDALAHGFCSVEADIYLVNGKLLVAHDLEKVRPEGTLRALYLDPLQKRVRENGGRVFPGLREFTLLIDFKSEAEGTYAALRDELKPFAGMLTQFETDKTTTNAVTIILSGNRPTQTVAAEPTRYVAIDGRLPDLDGDSSRHLIPLISDNWTKHFQWRDNGPLPEAENESLKRIVAKAHQQGRRIRFWAVPDKRDAWAALYEAGVDLINTDDLSGLAKYLRSSAPD